MSSNTTMETFLCGSQHLSSNTMLNSFLFVFGLHLVFIFFFGITCNFGILVM